MMPLSSHRTNQVIARYGRAVTIIEGGAIDTNKPWRLKSDGAQVRTKALALIQEPSQRDVRTDTSATASFQERQALLSIQGLTAARVLGAILQDDSDEAVGQRFHITHLSLVSTTGNNQIYRATLIAHKGGS